MAERVGDEGREQRGERNLAVLGISTAPACGVRDHATLLGAALERERVASRAHWLERSATGAAAERAEIRAWAREVTDQLRGAPPEAILLHYSVFAYAHRGIPLFLHDLLAPLRALRLPLISFLHEYAYPWRPRDPRATIWALSQRIALVELMRDSDAAIATIDERAEWLRARAWLPRRRVGFVPVFSTLPEPSPAALAAHERGVIGLFGYSYEGAGISLMLDALRLVLDAGAPVRLRLLGAPGPSSTAGRTWLEGAAARGIEHALSFSGSLAAQELADALAACELLLFSDAPGPTSRKTTLAASLASGRPVLASDGPHTWAKLRAAGAAEIAPPGAGAMAAAIRGLLEDPRRAEELGRRGRAFAAEEMGVQRSAALIAAMLDELVPAPG